MATFHVTVAGGGDSSGDSKANAFTLAEAITDLATTTAGDIYLFYGDGGAFTGVANYTLSVDGSTTARITLRGVDASGNPASGGDRPVFNMGTYYFYFTGDYYLAENLDLNGTASSGCILSGPGSHVRNCKVNNTSGTAGRPAIATLSTPAYIENNELISAQGNALDIGSSDYVNVMWNYCHDSEWGIDVTSGFITLAYNYIDTCDTAGLLIQSADNMTINHNTIYGCPIGISGTNPTNIIIMNNQIEYGNTETGISFSTPHVTNIGDNNNYWESAGSGTDATNFTKGPNATAKTPGYADAPNGDFSGVDDFDARVIAF